MRISDWSSDVCSSDLDRRGVPVEHPPFEPRAVAFDAELGEMREQRLAEPRAARFGAHEQIFEIDAGASLEGREIVEEEREALRSEEHPSELQSLMRSSYAVFCLKKHKKHNTKY